MNFHEFGEQNAPHVLLIHGGGNSWWNYLRQARVLAEQYHVILPVLNGHGEEYATPYVSTEDTADKLLEYINMNCKGSVFALCGVSLGGQIVIEMLARNPIIAQKAIIDGCVCYPVPLIKKYCMWTTRLFGRFLYSEKTSKKLLAQMEKMFPKKMHFTQEIKDYYLQDIPRLPLQTMYTVYQTYMDYHIKESLKLTTAEVMYWYGEKEMKCVKKSAQLVKEYVQNCKIYVAKGYNHGYLALYLPEEWLTIACAFFDE